MRVPWISIVSPSITVALPTSDEPAVFVNSRSLSRHFIIAAAEQLNLI
jgi:hypothetical protein